MLHEDVRPNDIVMLFSDGYSDNVYEDKFHICLEKLIDKETLRIDNYARAADC